MDFNNLEQVSALKSIFDQFDPTCQGLLDEKNFQDLLSYFEIDETFGPVMFRLLSIISKTKSPNNKPTIPTDLSTQRNYSYDDFESFSEEPIGITFDDFLNFFKLLTSGTTKEFFSLLFKAINLQDNERVGAKELVAFSNLMGDPITMQEANSIINDCLTFNQYLQNPGTEKNEIKTRPVRSNTISSNLSNLPSSPNQYKYITFSHFWKWYISEFPLSKQGSFNLTHQSITKSRSQSNIRTPPK